MLSEFGRFVRKRRIDMNVLLGDMADAVGVSSSFLSAVETGRKAVPKGEFAMRAAKFLQLDGPGTLELVACAEKSQKITTMPAPADQRHREVLQALARKLPDVDEERLARIEAEIDRL